MPGASTKLRQTLCVGKSDVRCFFFIMCAELTVRTLSSNRHAEFYVVTSKEVVASLKLSTESLPAVFMVSNEGEGILRYSGEILELNLSEWVLRFSSPAMGELTVDSTQGWLFPVCFVAFCVTVSSYMQLI